MKAPRYLCFFVYFLVGLSSSTSGTQHVSRQPQRELFRKMAGLRLHKEANEVVHNVTVNRCIELCVSQVKFNCLSFDYTNINGTCLLHNSSFLQYELDSSSAEDHYRGVYERKFTRLPGSFVSMFATGWLRVPSIEHCAALCWLETKYKCTGFNLERHGGFCMLTNGTVDRGLSSHLSIDFYERDRDDVMSNFIDYGNGALYSSFGDNVYDRVQYGSSLTACAQSCLNQTNFRCTSMDYNAATRACFLSKSKAGTAYGVNRTANGIHYEKKDKYEARFYPTPYRFLPGRADKTLMSVTLDQCAKECIEETEFVCRSFDFWVQRQTCYLRQAVASKTSDLEAASSDHVHHFDLKPSYDCGGNLTQTEGYVASPGWPYDEYITANQHCTWSLVVEPHKVIRVTFFHSTLGMKESEPDTNCSVIRAICSSSNTVQLQLAYDSNRCKDESSWDKAITSIPCLVQVNSDLPQVAVTQEHEAVVSYVRPDVLQQFPDLGFFASYQAVWPCNKTFHGPSGQFASPNWPKAYDKQSHCNWSIVAPHGATILLEFDSFNLEKHDNLSSCPREYDHVYVHSPSNHSIGLLQLSSSKDEYCGDLGNFTVSSIGNMLMVIFVSNGDIEMSGFHASYRFIFPSTVNQTTSATFSSTSMNVSAKNVEELLPPHQQADLAEPEVSSRSPVSFLPTPKLIGTIWGVICSLLILILGASVIAVTMRQYSKHRKRRSSHPAWVESRLIHGAAEENGNGTEEEMMSGTNRIDCLFGNSMYGRHPSEDDGYMSDIPCWQPDHTIGQRSPSRPRSAQELLCY